MHSVHPARLTEFVAAVCGGLGSGEAEATLVAQNLVSSNLAGHDSHGVGMLPLYTTAALDGDLAVNQHATVVRDGGATLVIDGNGGFGAAIGTEAIEMAIARVAETGVVAMGLRNSFHIGRIGYWAEMVTSAGYASIHFVSVRTFDAIVAPHGGADARFSTNPMAIGIPGGDRGPAVMLDMATSLIAMGKARIAHHRGEPVADGVLLDVDGVPTTDPAAMVNRREGALVAFGLHKGSGLAIMCELLGAALVGGETMQPGNPRTGAILNNMLTVIIDPDAMGGADHFRTETVAFIDHVRASRVRPGFDKVRAPGDPENEARAARAEGIPIDDAVVEQLKTAAAASGVGEFGALLD